MPRKRREITVILEAATTEDEYAQIANALWSVASMSGRLHGVQPDHLADPNHLNNWYDEDGKARWI